MFSWRFKKEKVFIAACIGFFLLIVPLFSRGLSEVIFAKSFLANKSHERGKRGPRGHRGHRGHRGCQGAKGIQGYRGEMGLQGQKGKTGLDGPVGPTGPGGMILIGSMQNLDQANEPPEPITQTFTITTGNPILDTRVLGFDARVVASGSDFTIVDNRYLISESGGGIYLVLYGITAEAGTGLSNSMGINPPSVQVWLELVKNDGQEGREVALAALPIFRTQSLDSNANTGPKEWLSAFGQALVTLVPNDTLALFVHFAQPEGGEVPVDTSLTLNVKNAQVSGPIDCGATCTLLKVNIPA